MMVVVIIGLEAKNPVHLLINHPAHLSCWLPITNLPVCNCYASLKRIKVQLYIIAASLEFLSRFFFTSGISAIEAPLIHPFLVFLFLGWNSLFGWMKTVKWFFWKKTIEWNLAEKRKIACKVYGHVLCSRPFRIIWRDVKIGKDDVRQMIMRKIRNNCPSRHQIKAIRNSKAATIKAGASFSILIFLDGW